MQKVRSMNSQCVFLPSACMDNSTSQFDMVAELAFTMREMRTDRETEEYNVKESDKEEKKQNEQWNKRKQ
eukprot:2932509-Amphidinium_carterae.2